MSGAFLALAVLGALLVLNALRPLPFTPLAVPSFFAGWLTSELAPHHLVLHVVGVAAFVASGALEGTAGWVALAVSGFTAAGLVVLINQSQQVAGVLERALQEGLGEDYGDQIAPDLAGRHDLRVPWRQLVLPFRRRHPDVERIRNIQYSEYGRRGRLDVYRHRDHPTGCPTLLQVHGGAWMIGNKDQQGLPLMLHLASQGWVCVAPNYRLSPRSAFPAHLIDIKRAIAWVREHGAEYGADPGFLVITGGSAGGHLTALAALTGNDPEYQPGFEDADTSVQAAVPYYGVYDFINVTGSRAVELRATRFLQRLVMQTSREEHREAWENASPWFRVNEDAPPFFVIHGAHDTLVPVAEARAFADRLAKQSRAPVVYAELPGTQHAFDVFGSIRTAHVIRAVERFVDYIYSAHLRQGSTKGWDG